MPVATGKKRMDPCRGKVLIIDDDKWVCETLTYLFARRHLDVDSAFTGRDGLSQIKNTAADLVILDFDLPDIDGLAVLSKLKKINGNLPVVFMTGYGSEKVSIKAFKLGIEDYFIKPIHPKKLESKVLEVIENRKKEADPNDGVHYFPELDENRIEEDSGIGRALQYIKNNFDSPVPLKKLAELAGCSMSHFSRTFKKLTDMTPTDYINLLRVKKAEHLISNNDTGISEVAFIAGFNSLRQFERAFKCVYGKSPTEYRGGPSGK